MDLGTVKSRSTFGQWLVETRTGVPMSRVELAERIREIAAAQGTYSGCNEQQVRRWERGDHVPYTDPIRWIAAALGVPVEIPLAMLDRPDKPLWGPVEPATADYIDAIRQTNHSLISDEMSNGGTNLLPIANSYLTDLRRRLALSPNPPSLDSDFREAAGAFVVTAAWFAHDADSRELARMLSYEALYLSRLVGDRQTEILALADLALFHLMTDRAQEALVIARMVLETIPLLNYQRVVFCLRESRALALLGATSEAFSTGTAALRDFADGPAPRTEEWWWLNPDELLGHMGFTYENGSRPELAHPLWQELSHASLPKWKGKEWIGQRYLRLTRLLGTATAVGDWTTAEETIDRLLPFVGVVHSGRTERMIRDTLRSLKGVQLPSSLGMARQQLSDTIDQV